jgi:uncharacterized membrane protein YphA (DoxX/SURF4 family)
MPMTILHVLLLLVFVPASLFKLAGHKHMRKQFAKFRYPYALAHLAGAIELCACVLLIYGFVVPRYAGLGALLLVPVMIGAAYTNFTRQPVAYGWGTLVLLSLCAIVGLHYLQLGGHSPKSTRNVATDDLPYLFDQRIHPTGVDLRALIRVARGLGSAPGHESPGMLAKAEGPYPA